MAKDNRNGVEGERTGGERATSLETAIRLRARGLIDAIVEEELDAALGATLSTRVGEGRQGYRHGTRARTLTTSLADALRDAAGSPANRGGRDRRMAERAGAAVSTPQ